MRPVGEPVPVLAAPGGEVDAPAPGASGHGQPLAGREAGERPVDQQVAALVEAEVSEVARAGGGGSVLGMAGRSRRALTAGSRPR